jgi:sugar/nucleoside kinase (ribokinase family)
LEGEVLLRPQNRETLETRLGVFADFKPRIPAVFRGARYVFLGNIDPELQLGVLDQVQDPTLVACDTMNYWIQSKRDVLLELLRRVDVLLVNDAEARQLSGDWNIYRAARWILQRGPRYVVVKQGEYGAVLVDGEGVFYVPGYPLEEVFDPTGAGDAFAGGFMAHLARTDDGGPENLRRAMVVGSAMGSFACEQFSVHRFDELTPDEVAARVRAFSELVRFDVGPFREGGG